MRIRTPALIIVPLTASLAAQDPSDILDRHLKAMGGLAKIQSVHAIRMKGSIQAALGLTLPVVMEAARPNKARMEIHSDERDFLRVFDGAQGWVSDPARNGELRPFTTAELQAAQSGTFDGELVQPEARGARVELEGRELFNQRDTYRLKITEKDGAWSRHWIDAQLFLEMQVEHELDTEEGKRTETTRYSDFRLVDGLPLAFHMVTGIRYSHDARIIQIDEVQLNPAIPDRDFAPPAKAAIQAPAPAKP